MAKSLVTHEPEAEHIIYILSCDWAIFFFSSDIATLGLFLNISSPLVAVYLYFVENSTVVVFLSSNVEEPLYALMKIEDG